MRARTTYNMRSHTREKASPMASEERGSGNEKSKRRGGRAQDVENVVNRRKKKKKETGEKTTQGRGRRQKANLRLARGVSSQTHNQQKVGKRMADSHKLKKKC